MKIDEMKQRIEAAKSRRAQTPVVSALIIAYPNAFLSDDPGYICKVLGLSDSYKSTVVATRRIRKELLELGFKVTNG